MTKKEKSEFKKLYNKHKVQLITLQESDDKILENILYDCPICNNKHLIEKHEHITLATYNIGTIHYKEQYLHCPNSSTDEADFISGNMLSQNANNRQKKLLKLMQSIEER